MEQADKERLQRQKQGLLSKAQRNEKNFEAMRGKILDMEKTLLADRKELSQARNKVEHDEEKIINLEDRMQVRISLAQ